MKKVFNYGKSPNLRLRFWIIISLIGVFPFVSYARLSTLSDDKAIEIKGDSWTSKPATRSLQVPFTAAIESGILTIQSEDVSCDLTICITDCQCGNVVYSMEVSQGNGSLITIPTDGWGSGQYCLTISNPERGYVFGYFSL